MQRISIENFGPVKKFEADVTDVMLLIGPQASGKSTISKSIFIFKSLKDEILNHIYAYNLENLPHRYIYDVLNLIKLNFFQYFGLNTDCKSFWLEYQYTTEKHITIYKYRDEAYLDIELSFTLENELNLLITEISNYKIISKEQQNKFKSLEEL
ncbi:MAG: AAA family ATPase [Nostocales cyanobacterium ELA583]|jgi:predicted ATPase